ncbi:hypothetical protein [Hyalangium rubrum]|uniref:4-vinyl reductase 4VR domain-containing protein n=1 Tax=Hyalangium rubrum TaxID=3103134 RepID=A0ABU5H2T6_9BACT|nr:hypothetical protein [Hyalangium sp. s54d21]MDY7227777.1 hypothetical protein [Hyalangium sp. s54d21]
MSDPYPNCQVNGQAVLSIVGGMEVVQARALRILAENGISPLKPEGWYPLTHVLNSFKLIFEKIGPSTVRAIGRKTPDTARFPPDIDSLEKGLRAIDVAYHMAHRGSEQIGGYHFEPRDRRSAKMMCDNPYPCDFDLGMVEAICDRFRPKDALWVRIEHDPKSCRRRGDTSCTYLITW